MESEYVSVQVLVDFVTVMGFLVFVLRYLKEDETKMEFEHVSQQVIAGSSIICDCY